jgi:hypothetical protein
MELELEMETGATILGPKQIEELINSIHNDQTLLDAKAIKLLGSCWTKLRESDLSPDEAGNLLTQFREKVLVDAEENFRDDCAPFISNQNFMTAIVDILGCFWYEFSEHDESEEPPLCPVFRTYESYEVSLHILHGCVESSNLVKTTVAILEDLALIEKVLTVLGKNIAREINYANQVKFIIGYCCASFTLLHCRSWQSKFSVDLPFTF